MLTVLVGLAQAQGMYEDKLKSMNTVPDKTLFKLAWQVKELQDLVLEVRSLLTECAVVSGKCQDESCDLVQENVARRLNTLRGRLEDAVKKLCKHQRTAASHIFVVMVSSESRKQKP